MPAPFVIAAARFRALCFSARLVVLVLFAAAVTWCAPPVARALSPADTAQWTPSVDWSGGDVSKYAIHMMLLRGDGSPYHSRILWWNGMGSTRFAGGEWGWKPGSEGCSSYPSANFEALSVPLDDMNMFCSGNAPTASGSMFIPGGTDHVIGTYGENRARLWTDGPGTSSGAWSDAGTMQQHRWYPTTTTLADGRMLVLAGSAYRHHRFFGGRRNGSLPSGSVADSVYRFAPLVGGRWDPTVVPAADPVNGRPAARERHTGVQLEGISSIAGQVILGGRGADGQPLDDVWVLHRTANYTGNDYAYNWEKKPGLSGVIPKRSDHSAIVRADSEMIVYGGRAASGSAVAADVYRLATSSTPQWIRMTVSGTGPSARFGHNAIYDTTRVAGEAAARRRMIVFGGIGADGQTPSDLRVWELRFDPSDLNHGTWYEMPQRNMGISKPGPRTGHTMVWDQSRRLHAGTGKFGHVALVFGGQLDATAYSDTLWALWVLSDGDSVAWEPWVFAGAPSARAHHGAIMDEDQGESGGRLYIYGGENSSSPPNDSVYVLNPWTGTPTWQHWAGAGFDLSGHSVVLDYLTTEARVAEIYDPIAGSWQADPSTTLLQHTYPPTFVVGGGSAAGGRVVSIGEDNSSYWVDIPASGQPGAWTRFANGALGFDPEAAVMYRPNRIMAAGGSGGPGITGMTRTLDAGNLNAAWQSSDTLVARIFHNLVLLPDGKVLAVGGMGTTANYNTPVRRPQIWNPDGNGGLGAWSDTSLARQPTMRNYHSTAIVLPDGRVLSASGEGTPDLNPDKYLANLFCPPYLFDANGNPASRPVIENLFDRMLYNRPFTVCTPLNQSVYRACLIRAPATTHSFDQNQRYLPLTIQSTAADSSSYVVAAPADSFVAPPGDYLLFLLNGRGVPCVARWVRVGVADGPGSTGPNLLPDFMTTFVTNNAIELAWATPADRDPGIVDSFTVRRATQAITNDAQFDAATIVPQPPAPACCPGRYVFKQVSNLHASTTYWFAEKSRDIFTYWSGFSRLDSITTLTSGGGGGASAHPVAGAASIAAVGYGGSGAAAVIGSGSITPTTIVIESGADTTARTLRAWREPLDAGWNADSAEIVIQSHDPSGAWRTDGRLERSDWSQLAAFAPPEGMRYVLRGGFALEQLSAAVRMPGSSAAWRLQSAEQTGTGALSPDSTSGVVAVSLGASDTLVARYSAGATSGSASWALLLAGPAAPTTQPARALPPPQGADLPTAFALHPNRPNPFASATAIGFDLLRPAHVTLEVFDLMGRHLRTLASGSMPAGFHRVDWDRRDQRGQPLAAGVYVYRLRADSFVARRKLVVLP